MAKTRANGTARRDELIAIATRLVARNGARGTTLADIAKEAGVSQAAVVYHFGTKDGLLHAILDARDRFEDSQVWRLGPDPGIRIFEVIAEIVSGWADNPDVVGLLSVLIAENIGTQGPLRARLADNYSQTLDRIASTLRAAQERGEMRKDVDARLKAIEVLAFLSGLELAWLVSPTMPAAEAAASWAREQASSLSSAESKAQ